jgi:hypothetical protein
MSVPGLGQDHVSYSLIDAHKQELLPSAGQAAHGLATNCNGLDKKPTGDRIELQMFVS